MVLFLADQSKESHLKRKRFLRSLIAVLVLIGLTGGAFMTGIWTQKNMGFGNVLRSLGLDYSAGEQEYYQPTVPLDEVLAMEKVGLPDELVGKMSLFVMAGQSNMSGKGILPEIQHVNYHIYVFGNDYRWRLALEPIDSPMGQVDDVSRDLYARYSPALSFATNLHAMEPERIIGLIPCAKGETSIMEWQQNYSDQSLYGSCLKRIHAAEQTGRIDGIIFFQGEADTVDPGMAPRLPLAVNNYAEMFEKYVNDMRADLGDPNLPVVFAQIGSNKNNHKYANWTIIQQQQKNVVLTCSAMITSDDLELRDEIHYTTASYQIIGERFAKAFHDLLSSSVCK
jgi:Carbohydrate esterase, sialic acid-specific acetylesterase